MQVIETEGPTPKRSEFDCVIALRLRTFEGGDGFHAFTSRVGTIGFYFAVMGQEKHLKKDNWDKPSVFEGMSWAKKSDTVPVALYLEWQ